MGRIKNMGTATMQFKEGVYVTGSAHNPDGTDSDYTLVVSGTIGVQNLIERIGDPDTAIIFEDDKIFLDATDVIVGTETTAGSHPLTVSGSMNVLGDPTAVTIFNALDGTNTLDRTKWYYRDGTHGDTQIDSVSSVNNTLYQPRNLTDNVNVVSSSFDDNESTITTSDTALTFLGGDNRTRMLTYKETFSNDVTVTFYLIAGGGGSSAGSDHVVESDGIGTLAHDPSKSWRTNADDTTNDPIQLVYSTDGFDVNATWQTVPGAGSIYGYDGSHPYADGQSNDPDSNQDNIDHDGFYAFRFTLTGVSQPYYIGLRQVRGTASHPNPQNAWAVAKFSIQDVSDAKNGYINFTTGSTTVEGVDGYGFRINQSSGDMQFRDSTGDADWVDFKSFAVGGSDGQVQYNNGGVLDGASNLFYDDANDRVGIGTVSPDELLHVSGSSTTTVLIGEGSAGGTTRTAQLKLAADNGNTTVTGSMFVDSPGGSFDHFMSIGTDSNHNLRLKSNNTTRIIVSGSGQVGIGSFTSNTLDEAFNLHIQQDESLGAGVLLSRKDSSIANAERLGSVFFGGTTDGVNFDYGALIESRTAGTWTPGSDTPANIKFWTTDDGSSTAIQRMMIRHDGNVGIGDALVPANHKLEVAGDIGINEKLVHRGDTDTYLSFASNDVRISAGGSETLTVLNSGVGIGLTSPQAELHIEASNDDADIVLSRNDSNIQNDDTLGTVHFAGTENGTTWGYGARIAAIASDDWAVGSDIPTRLAFYTTNAGAGSATQKMVIGDTGHVGIGLNPGQYSQLSVTSSIKIEGGSLATKPTLYLQNNDVNLPAGSTLGKVSFVHYNNVVANESAFIEVQTDGSYATNTKSKMFFKTSDGSSSPTEVMRIEDQSVMIGAPTPSDASGYTLTVDGTGRFQSSLTVDSVITTEARLVTDEIVTNTNSQQIINWDTVNQELKIGAGTLVNTSIRSGQGGVPLYADSGATYGQIRIGTVDGDPQYSDYNILSSTGLYVEGFANNNTIATFVNRSLNDDSDGISIIIGSGSYINSGEGGVTRQDQPGTNNSFIKFTQKDRGVFGPDRDPDGILLCAAITGDGSGGVVYNTSFTGKHFSVIAKSNATLGFIVKSTGNLLLENEVSTALPSIVLADSIKDKRVYGVIGNIGTGVEGYKHNLTIADGEQDVDVNSLGEGKVWVTNIGGSIENGDYITSSNIAGYGMLQDDDILHNYTVAKCTQTVDWSTITDTIDHEGVTYKKYLIACTYHCG